MLTIYGEPVKDVATATIVSNKEAKRLVKARADKAEATRQYNLELRRKRNNND